MYKVDIINLTNKKSFTKTFDSPYLMNKFIKKCKYSKKIKIIGIIKENW